MLIDATLVLSVLFPTSLKLVGDRNWYLPAWVDWLPEVFSEGQESSSSKGPEAIPAGGDD